MAEDRDQSDERKPDADPLGNDDDTEKGEARSLADEADEEAKAAEPKSAAKTEAKDDEEDDRDAKSDAREAKADDDDREAKKAEASDDEDEDDREAKGDGEKDDAKKADAKPAAKTKEKSGGSRWWVVLLVVLVVEFYVYGRNGDIEVCVGKQDVHDFSLVGQERTDDNRWKFPRCEARVNLGLRSQYDELVEDATNVACRGATLFRNRGEGPQCVAGEQGWTKQVETSYIWPWDSRYYKHLLWFVFE